MAVNVNVLRDLVVRGESLEAMIASRSLKMQILYVWSADVYMFVESSFDSYNSVRKRIEQWLRSMDMNGFNGASGERGKAAFGAIMGTLRSLYNQQVTTNPGVEDFDATSQQVFIVHGHDDTMIDQTKQVIYDMGLSPVVLREQADQGRTIMEKLEGHIGNAKGAVVLYTPDDEGRDVDGNGELTSRARENVVFEHGWVHAKFGRGRVALLSKDNVQLPGDLGGMVYIPVNDGWKDRLTREIEAWDQPK